MLEGVPFDSVEHMDEVMVERWNAKIGARDIVYHMGDVAIHKRNLETIHRLNGRKILILGNHDVEKASKYLQYFSDVRAFKMIPKMFVATHVPIHAGSIGRFKFNVHGHLHERVVLNEAGEEDLRYLNVSVERINYTPISVDEIWAILSKRIEDGSQEIEKNIT